MRAAAKLPRVVGARMRAGVRRLVGLALAGACLLVAGAESAGAQTGITVPATVTVPVSNGYVDYKITNNTTGAVTVTVTVTNTAVIEVYNDYAGDDEDDCTTYDISNYCKAVAVPVSAGGSRDLTIYVTDGVDGDATTITHAATGYTIPSTSVTVGTPRATAGVTVSASIMEVTQGSSDTYNIKLTTEPSDTVTIAVSSNSTDFTVSPGSVKLHSNNYSAGVDVTVTAGSSAGGEERDRQPHGDEQRQRLQRDHGRVGDGQGPEPGRDAQPDDAQHRAGQVRELHHNAGHGADGHGDDRGEQRFDGLHGVAGLGEAARQQLRHRGGRDGDGGVERRGEEREHKPHGD